MTPWSAARQALLSMGFPRQEYWRGLSFPSQGIFLTQGTHVSCIGGWILYCWATREASSLDYMGHFLGLVFYHFILEIEKFISWRRTSHSTFFCCLAVLWATSIHRWLSSQCQNSASDTKYHVTYPSYAAGNYSDFQKLLFTSHFLSGSKGE